MKANRKAFNNDEEAVSPVIAVILMVAITVVLAATVFVLVNELGQDVGSTGPNIGLTTHTSATDSDKWTLTLTSTTRDVSIDEYTFILTVDGESNSSRWRDTDGVWADDDENRVAGLDDGAYFQFNTDCYQLTHTDIASDDRLGAGDRLVMKVFDTSAGAGNGCDEAGIDNDSFDDDMSDHHELELLHRPSGSGAGSISRNF